MVSAYCRANAVPFEGLTVDIPGLCPKGVSVEMFSRDVRYAFFNGLRKKYGFSHIATAHNADDEDVYKRQLWQCLRCLRFF